MNTWRKQIIYYKSISWLLVAAFLLFTLLPAHYHLHHLFSGNSVTNTQVIDLHLITDKAGQSHHDKDAKILTTAPDRMVKKDNPELFPLILLVVSLILLPLIYCRSGHHLGFSNIRLKQFYYHFSPPLRAPPLL